MWSDNLTLDIYIFRVDFVCFACSPAIVEREMRTVKSTALEKYNMLPTTCCIRVISYLLAGGAVYCGVVSWDAAPYLRGAVGYGAY